MILQHISTWVLTYHCILLLLHKMKKKTEIVGKLVSYTILLHIMCIVILFVSKKRCADIIARSLSFTLKFGILLLLYKNYKRNMICTPLTVVVPTCIIVAYITLFDIHRIYGCTVSPLEHIITYIISMVVYFVFNDILR